jgi:hypothetical protein
MYDINDCNEMINQLKAEIDSAFYSLNDSVQVLRTNKSLYEGYYPIVFYYPTHEVMLRIFSISDDPFHPSELMTNREFLEKYENERHTLELKKIQDVLFELDELSNILKS